MIKKNSQASVSEIEIPQLNFVVCIENQLYKNYLTKALKTFSSYNVLFIDKTTIANAVAENSNVILILQSDDAEYQLIEIASKLKRVFSNEIKIIFLSLDYILEPEISAVVDKFLQFPLLAEDLVDAAIQIVSPNNKVLLIDDSKLVHTTIVGDLDKAGFQVFQAFNGEEGFNKASEVHPGVIICDIEMPKMNGYETCKAIRENKDLVGTHIIMSSTLGSAADQKKGFEVGVDEYITKPVDIPELIERISKVFSKASSGRENIILLDKGTRSIKDMKISLTKQGFNVRETDSIKSAIKSLNRLSGDLVISEIEPKDGSIIDLFHELSFLDKSKAPDILVIVEADGRSDARMAINAGAAGVITKPFTMDALLAQVERSLADRRSRKEKEQLGRYVSKASMRMAIEKAILDNDDKQARADRKSASVFFSDIANFTDRCERYNAKEIVEQINLLFEVMTRVIMKNHGDIDKFIGDACMAFWLDEASISSSDAVLKSILEMQEQIEVMNSEHPILSQDPILVRMGANKGEVILCDIGAADARVDLTIIGDCVNVAARLESASKQYGLTNLISEETVKGNEKKYLCRIVDKVRVKGKIEPLICYELLSVSGSASKKQLELKNLFEMGFRDYQNGEFRTGLAKFQQSKKLELDLNSDINPSSVYIDRCQYLINNPPKDWDGIWSLTEK